MSLDAIIHRPRPSWLQLFWASPFKTCAKWLYSRRSPPKAEPHGQPSITIVCISDSHNAQPHVSLGDVLIHAGDLTQRGTRQELQDSLDWLNRQPHEHKIAIAGNHDMILDVVKYPEQREAKESLNWGTVILLQDSSATVKLRGGRSIKLFGCPHTRKHGNWAFQYDIGTDVFANKVPDDVDILITHMPPRFHLDLDGFGDGNLLREVWRTRPKLHVFGHIHEGYGRDTLIFDEFESLFEQVSCGTRGLLALWRMGLLLLAERFSGPDRNCGRTILVNPSFVGGLTDSEERKPLVVQI